MLHKSQYTGASLGIREANWRPRLETVLTLGGIVFTFVIIGLVSWEQLPLLIQRARNAVWGELAVQIVFLLIVGFLIYGGLVYQFTRLGYVQRRLVHRPVSQEVLEEVYDGPAPALTILVPSYKEERRVVFQTLMSAALQEYPNRRVVLLIDNPPAPSNPVDAALLADARELPDHIQALLQQPSTRLRAALQAFLVRQSQGVIECEAELRQLAVLWREVSTWFTVQIDACPIIDHADSLYADVVLASRRDQAEACACHLETLGASKVVLDADVLGREYRKLDALFSVEIDSFERKRYLNLSHESNKAMNLNSYMGLVGKHYRELLTPEGRLLKMVDEAAAELSIPSADYFITLDADSILLPEYALRLIYLMEQVGNEHVAVAQTPYSAFPGAKGVLERVAGATTDMQYIIHQGFTHFCATYWVGANALLRRAALEDIAVTEMERGYPVRRFIQDRTVIEDTESSVDLADRGWTLYNYPERLAYSATPPDFGSLVIQRQRWANGGLIILPKLLRYLARGPGRLRKLPEAFFRFHYLTSIAVVNLGLLVILAVPSLGSTDSVWLPLSALPYFLLYGRDLVLAGYRRSDLLRVYALNLLLIPVNLGGVAKSLQQAVTGKRIPFGRTPKIRGRTAAPPLYIVVTYLLFAHWMIGAGVDIISDRWMHGIFAFINAAFLLYAIAAFVGFRHSIEDLTAGLAQRRVAKHDDALTIEIASIGHDITAIPRTPYFVGRNENQVMHYSDQESNAVGPKDVETERRFGTRAIADDE